MAVVITDSTSGGYRVFSSANATLATAISEVINELEQHSASMTNTQFTLTWDGTNYVYMATVRRGPGKQN